MGWITGVGDTRFGRLEGETALSLMASAATAALADAGLEREAIDGVLCGYAGTLPHLMLATLFAEYFGLRPRYAHGPQAGGATGAASAGRRRRTSPRSRPMTSCSSMSTRAFA